ncbi:MAG: glycosyltransferase family 4 protein [Anaerolineales bacterium]|nr:glycosyltransferase family 4 protein [Anaerolineales bacterium]
MGKKIQSQVASWSAMGHEASLFMHTSNYEPQIDLIDASYFFYTVSGKIKTEFNRIAAMRRMLAAIRDFQPDIIYLRYGIYVFPAHRLMDIAPVVEEINTNDLTQHEGLGGVYSNYNRITRGIFLRRVHGLVTVSHELKVSPAFASYRKPTQVIANGVDLETFEQLPAPENESPRLVFIGNPGYPWHGIDKLVALAELVPDIQMDIIGYDQLAGFEPLPKNISLHGYLGMDAYKAILSQADAAISSIALHRVQLEEASPLKSRECLAFGLPLIIAYADTDLNESNCDFLMKIPNREDNIQTHAQAIREFLYRIRGYRVPREKILNLDQKGKEQDRIEFFNKILHESKM